MSKRRDLFYVLICYVFALTGGYVSFIYFNDVMSNLLWATLLANCVTTIIIFIASVLADNSSVYDPYWSAIPPFIFILWVIVLEVNIRSIIVIMMGVAILIWSIRLTLNWTLNWRGIGHEDWRYKGFRKRVGKWYWLISFLAIHLFPTLMVYLGMLPVYFGLQSSTSNSMLLVLGFIISLGAVTIAYLADRHLMIHRHSKNSQQSINRGVWRISRHPNYLGEIMFWFGCFVMGISTSFEYLFTIIGFLAMVLLFEGYSIPAMEKRLLQSKGNYKAIQQTVPRLFPLVFLKHRH